MCARACFRELTRTQSPPSTSATPGVPLASTFTSRPARSSPLSQRARAICGRTCGRGYGSPSSSLTKHDSETCTGLGSGSARGLSFYTFGFSQGRAKTARGGAVSIATLYLVSCLHAACSWPKPPGWEAVRLATAEARTFFACGASKAIDPEKPYHERDIAGTKTAPNRSLSHTRFLQASAPQNRYLQSRHSETREARSAFYEF